MTRVRRSVGIVFLSAGLAIGAMFGGNILQTVQFARAEQQVQTSRENLAKAEDLSTVFRETSKAVEPSVVNIAVRKTIKSARLPFDEDTLRRMLPHFRGGDDGADPSDPQDDGNDNGRDTQSYEQVGQGSGVIVDVDGKIGYIVTNNHVAGGAEELSIALSDGRVIENAKVVGTDPKSDIAVLKVESEGLIAAKWGDSSVVQKGDWVMAFGAPFGYVGSMTHGIVSALNRDKVGILNSKYAQENFIQVDAPINPGNSGGPLVNVRGEIVGINTAIASSNGGFQGIGFAIPSNQAKYVYQQIKDKGKVVRGFLGVAIRSAGDPDERDVVESFGYTKTGGVFIHDVMSNAPASDKLKAGDIVEEINGKPVKTESDLRTLVSATPPDTELTFKVFRDHKEQDVKVKIGEQPNENGVVASSGRPGDPNKAEQGEAANKFGFEMKDLSEQMVSRLGFDRDVKGALITRVDPRSIAAHKGLRPRDVITAVGDKTVTSAKEVRDTLAKADLAKGVRLTLVAPEGSRFIVLKTK